MTPSQRVRLVTGGSFGSADAAGPAAPMLRAYQRMRRVTRMLPDDLPGVTAVYGRGGKVGHFAAGLGLIPSRPGETAAG